MSFSARYVQVKFILIIVSFGFLVTSWYQILFRVKIGFVVKLHTFKNSVTYIFYKTLDSRLCRRALAC